MDLNNKKVVISGATGGMAVNIAELLSDRGCELALFARRENKLKDLSESLDSKCIYKKCDVSEKKQVEDAVKFTKEKFGRIDAAILSAGVLIPNPIQKFDGDIIKKSMDINFMGIVNFLEHLFPIMKKQNFGNITAISTLPDKRGVPGWGAYGASKAAVSWLMESLRAEAKQRYNIEIITVKPGTVKTPMIEKYPRVGAISPEKAAELIVKGIEKGKRVIQFPLGQLMLIRSMDMFPPFAYDLFPVESQKGEGYPEVDEEK